MKTFYNTLGYLLIIGVGLFLSIQVSRAQQTPVHFWYFDDNLPNNTPLTSLDASFGITAENAYIEYKSALMGYPFTSDHLSWRKASMERRNNPTDINYRPIANQSLPYEANQMRGLQVKQPFTGDAGENTMIFHLPTTGYENVIFSFAAVNEGAADSLLIEYSSAAGTAQWLATGAYPLDTLYKLFTLDFSAQGINIAAANNNPDFKVRIRFKGEAMSIDNGDRVTFNNISLDANPMEGTNQPPFITGTINFQKLIEGSAAVTINFSGIFVDPEGSSLTLQASSNRPNIVQAEISNTTLALTPLQQGDAEITLTASDGVNPAVPLSFRVLVYPEAFDLSQGDFSFTQWSPTQPEFTYPDNMLFVQSDKDDPALDYELLFPYQVPHDDYHADDMARIGFPYDLSSRTRISGMGENGVSFINTGRDRDLGGAIVAINTINQTNLMLSFKNGTILRNERLYAFRLQYRIGSTGNFSDLLKDNLPVQYIASNDGDLIAFDQIPLPQILLGREYVQLMWRYYLHSGDTGPRSQLRLDDIIITKGTAVLNQQEIPFKLFAVGKNLFVENNQAGSAVLTIYNIAGQKVYGQPIDQIGMQTINLDFESGIYIVNLRKGEFNFSKKLVLH